MIVRKLRIFLQNVRKNSLILNMILKTQNHFDIILIQEPPWSDIRKVPCSSNCDGEPLVGTCHHPNWTTFARSSPNIDDSPRVIIYINICLSFMRFLLRKDIFDHRDICLISFFNNCVCYYILNIYSDSSHLALKYHKDTEVNISNVLLMTVSQTSFSWYLHNQWTDFHKLSCAGKLQMSAICTYAGCTKATTND